MAKITQRITPFLWLDDRAEEAANFYVSIFENSRIKGVSRYTDEASKAAGRPKGSVMTVAFELDGQDFTALNELREGYNRFYVLEKECVVRSLALARVGFVPLPPMTLAELTRLLPPLYVPR